MAAAALAHTHMEGVCMTNSLSESWAFVSTQVGHDSHFKRWIVDRTVLKQSRAEDLRYVDDPVQLQFMSIFFSNTIAKLCKKLQLRQRVTATATVFFRRFYLKNSYCETDPFIVIAACCYVASKAEESPVHIKTVVTEARLLFGNEEYGLKSFPSDNSKLAEMEFYLVDDLECDLVVFHPYRTLLSLCGREGVSAGVGGGTTDTFSDSGGHRYWGSAEGKLELQEGALQLAWFIINDTYRSELCLLYPPHLIAIAAIYLTVALHSSTRSVLTPSSTTASTSHNRATRTSGNITPQTTTRRSSRSTTTAGKKQPQDVIGFLAGLNVNMSLVATIAQEIISLYILWGRYKEDGTEASGRTSFQSLHSAAGTSGTRRSTGSVANTGSSSSPDGTLSPADDPDSQDHAEIVTPAFLTRLLTTMRERKIMDVAPMADSSNERTERA